MTLQCPLGKCQPVPIDAEADGPRLGAHPEDENHRDSPQPSLI